MPVWLLCLSKANNFINIHHKPHTNTINLKLLFIINLSDQNDVILLFLFYSVFSYLYFSYFEKLCVVWKVSLMGAALLLSLH